MRHGPRRTPAPTRSIVCCLRPAASFETIVQRQRQRVKIGAFTDLPPARTAQAPAQR
ncbi:hypothetical protein BVI2075_20013 [Burkholderia vietnamiensis]|nr:hypothetical protein BVI2075_20013 [Burkholderia vietnamiensis]